MPFAVEGGQLLLQGQEAHKKSAASSWLRLSQKLESKQFAIVGIAVMSRLARCTALYTARHPSR
jgi:hypothetical protein